jgi:hypothetical protein
MVGPLDPWGGVGSTVIQSQDLHAVRKGLSERIDEKLEALRVPRGSCQEKPLPWGRGHGPIDVEPCEGVLDHTHWLDTPCGEAPATDRQHAETAFVLTEDPNGAGILGWDDIPQPLPTPRLECRNGLRIFWCDWAVGL